MPDMFLAAAFIVTATLLAEIGGSLGKYATRQKIESIYSFGFLNLLWAVSTFALTLSFRPDLWLFSWASLPTLSLRIVVEAVASYVSLKAMFSASRGTFSVVRSATIPLVLLSDVLLGTIPNQWQLVGIGIILVTLLALGVVGGLERKGLGYVWASAILAAVSLTLFKYDTLHYNSVLTEQLFVCVPLVVLMYIAAKRVGDSPFALIRKRPIVLIPCAIAGVTGLLESFAFAWLPLSIATTMNRAFSSVWGVLFGKRYFHEVHMVAKLIGIVVIVLGFFLLFF